MRNITLLPIVNRNCVTFEIGNLLIRDPSIKIYNLFIEFGDGSFTSFATKEDEPETGRTTVYSKFSHLYTSPGTYMVKGNVKATYSDDGDPLYPTIPTLEISSMGDDPCSTPVASKLHLPKVSSGPSLLGSHMPKFEEQNVYVINYNELQFKAGNNNQLILFYNEKSKPFAQWNALPSNPSSNCRHGSTVKAINAGTVAQLLEQSGYSSDHPTWVNLINTYKHYAAFEVSAVNGSHQNNIFLDLTGHKELEMAIKEEENDSKEHVKLAVCHVLKETNGLQFIANFQHTSDPLSRFHDPNYIYVSPLQVDPDDISTTIWTYDLSISNDGNGTASDVKAHVILDTNFFDLSTIIGVETAPFRHDRMELEADGVSFFWDGIALPGINLPDNNKLTIRFSIQPKTNYIVPEQLSAHAVVDMFDGSIKETTMTEEVAVTEIVDSDRTRQFKLEDILPNKDVERTI